MRVASTDADVQELADEGIHVCIAAGNSRQKIDVPVALITTIGTSKQQVPDLYIVTEEDPLANMQ